jgi:hypothetical protein
MTKLLWADTRVVNGVRFTAEVRQHWMAGHGPFPDRWRWTVYRESEFRPLMRSGWTGGYYSSIGKARDALAGVR